MRFVTTAPAKVNLVLRVGPRRPDGYHEIQTLMVPLDLADDVDVRIATRPGPVTCLVPGHPELDGESNLAARAAETFRRAFGVSQGVAIRIGKRIPITAGLGGGSSDAAAVLRCLARAHRIADRAALSAIGLEVGSDVPFFLGEGPAWARGRGEALAAAKVPSLHLALVHPRDPALAIRAGEAYAWLDEARQGAPRPRWPPRRPRFALSRTGNDLEPPCVEKRPALRRILELLKSNGASKAIMSGSGPSVFGVFPSRSAASKAVQAIEREAGTELKVFVVRTTLSHPRVAPWKSPRSASSP